MKIKLLVLQTIIILFFVSCSSDVEDNKISKVNEESLIKIQNVLNTKDKESQLVAFRMMSSREKYEFWNQKLNDLKIGLEGQERILVEDLISKLSFRIYEEGDDYKAYFNNIYAKEFKVKARKMFSDKFVVENFYQLSKVDGGGGIDDGGVGGASNCNCLRGNIGGWDCGVFTGEWCNKPAQSCKEVDGCGLLNSSFCDGICG